MHTHRYTLGDTLINMADIPHFGGNLATQSALITPLQDATHTIRIMSRSQANFYNPASSNVVTVNPLLVPTGLTVIALDTTTASFTWVLPTDVATAPVSVRATAYRLKYTDVSTKSVRVTDVVGILESSITVRMCALVCMCMFMHENIDMNTQSGKRAELALCFCISTWYTCVCVCVCVYRRRTAYKKICKYKAQ
jgi:hypothetical protein